MRENSNMFNVRENQIYDIENQLNETQNKILNQQNQNQIIKLTL